MPIPSTKIFLPSALAAGRAVRILPVAAGDFAPLTAGVPVAPWVSSVSDLNGDGRADIIFGAAADSDKFAGAGRVFVQFGGFTGGSTLSLGDSINQLIIDGVNAGDHAGASVGSIADLNGDGKGEILIGAPGMDVGAKIDAGAAFVVFGKTTGGVDLNDPFTASGGGYAIKGEAAGDAAGTTILSIADLNGDGKMDVIVGAPGNDAGGADAGAAYVVFGKSTNSIVNLTNVAAGTGGYKIIGTGSNDAVGSVIGTTSDMNGDGKAEILIGMPEVGSHGTKAGAVYVSFGKSTGTAVDLNDVAAGIGGFVINGMVDDSAGAAISGIGDVNGDGLGDILVGAPRSDHAYVVFGKANGTAVDLADVRNGIGGFQILGQVAGDLDQISVTGGRDINHDGINDIVIGTPSNDEGGSNAGAVYLVWGGGHATVDLSAIAQSMGGAKIVGAAGSLTGTSVAISSDLNADGTLDLVIGAPGVGESAYVLYGDASWQPDTNVYGTNGVDNIGPGYGSTHLVGDTADNIIALAGNDIINAAGGNDTIDGGTGNDSMTGGLGDDTYYVDSALDGVTENLNEGIDTVIASVNHTLAANVENLVLSGFGLSGTGNALANSITGTAGNDVINGGANADTMTGGAGNDSYVVDDTGDEVIEAAGGGIDTVTTTLDGYTLAAEVENLILSGVAHHGTGNALANTITGNNGNDTIDGGAGSDTMSGGAGSDSYIVDNIGDVVVEALNGGTDTVTASVDYTLGANVEKLILIGAATHGTGNDLANTITGTSGNDILDGGSGIDTLIGGLGDDTYIVDNAADVITEVGGQGNDTVIAAFDYTLGAGSIENLTLSGAAHHGTGNAGANVITGGTGDDTLDGGAGVDTLVGGAGNDTYLVDTTTDHITEAVGGGTDTIVSSVDYALTEGSNVENLTLTGGAHHATGNSSDNTLTGGAGIDLLEGGLGNDTLDGGAGADNLIGGDGNDTYFIDNPGDTIIETATGGNDTVVVNSDWTLADNIENVTLVGTGHVLTGNAANNTLKGDTGDDTLDGGSGDDTELGGDGNDTLISNSGHDVLAGGSGDDVYKIHGGAAHIEDFQGHDTIDASDGSADQHIDLSGETQTEIENEICDFGSGGTITGALNVQFLQDLTGSFGDDIANVRTLVPQIVTALQGVSGGAAFGVSTFRDKAFGAFGGAGDWVYATSLAMGATPTALVSAYTGFIAGGGSDLPEAQLEALMQLGLRANGEVGFQSNSARFAVIFTDASFHTAADGLAAGLLTPNNGDIVLDGAGIGENYPEILQVRAALEAANIIPIFAIAGGFETIYQGLVTNLGRGAVVTLTADSSNIVTAITSGLTTATTTHIADALGGTGDDVMIGNVGANMLSGNNGNDTLEGRQSDDVLHGGAGNDTAVYSGLITDYTITANTDGSTTITDNRVTGGDGIDTLDGIEFLKFGAITYTITGVPVTGTVANADTVLGLAEATRLDPGIAAASGNVLVNDTTAAGPLVVSGVESGTAGTFTVVAGPTIIAGTYGDLTINPDGSYSYALDNTRPATEALNTGDAVSDVFTYEAKDINGVTSTAQISVSVAGATDVPAPVISPTADNLQVTIAQASALDASILLANDTISNGEGMTVTSVSNAVGATVDLVGGKLVITATGAASSFDYGITSATGVTSTAHVTVGGLATSLLANNMKAAAGFAGADLVGLDGNDTLTGNAGTDRLDGGLGNDKLNGGTGADHMTGGAGNDIYTVDNAGDSVDELVGGGTDKVITSLLSYTLGDNVEQLTGTGIGDYQFTGNVLANMLTGGAGNDTLIGLDGKDILTGGVGNDLMIGGVGVDTLNGGVGADSFRFDSLTVSADKDTVKDFEIGIDHLEFDRAVFSAFSGHAAGALGAGELFFGTKATAIDQHLIYNSTTGGLFYDADGMGGLAQVQIATLTNHALISAGDILLV